MTTHTVAFAAGGIGLHYRRLGGHMQRVLVIAGLLIVAMGLAWPWLMRAGLGRLPGDIVIQRGNTTFYFPIVTCIIVSVVLSVLFWIFRR